MQILEVGNSQISKKKKETNEKENHVKISRDKHFSAMASIFTSPVFHFGG